MATASRSARPISSSASVKLWGMPNREAASATAFRSRSAMAKTSISAEKPGYANRYTYVIGSEGDIEHVFTSVNPQTEPADLLAKLGA